MLLIALGARAAGSDPAGRLAYWRFEDPQWADVQGRHPLAAANVTAAPSFDGAALCQSSTNSPACLLIGCADTTGARVLAPAQGAIRFLYKPLWASPDTVPRLPRAWPRTPGRWLRLFEAGVQGPQGRVAQWMMSIDPVGTNLIVHTRDAAGAVRTNLQVPISWTAAVVAPRDTNRTEPVQWREIILNYGPETCALIVNGVVQQDWFTRGLAGQGLPPLAGSSAREQVFSIGSTLTGELPAEGLFDEVETFDRTLSPLRSYAYLAQTGLHAEIAASPPSVKLSWFTLGNERQPLERVEPGNPNPLLLATNLTGMSYTDTRDLRLGGVYMYRLGGQRLIVGVNQPPTDQRGRAIVLVDRTLASGLRSELDQFLADLAGDGWTVSRHDAPRHDDDAWKTGPVNAAYRTDVARIRSLVAAEYRAAPDQTCALILIGHVTIPYSGLAAEDGHIDHNGAWPADAYYGDIQGDWTDETVRTASSVQNPLLRNIPDDGKFDQHMFPKPTRPDATRAVPGLDLAVGRIDFARLPAFRGTSERNLLRQYLTKNHRYRHKELTFRQSALIGGYFGNPYHNESRVLYHIGNLLAYRLYRPVLETVLDGDALAADASAVWAVQGGYGHPTALHNSVSMNPGLGVKRVDAADLAQSSPTPKAGFYVLKGSYFGDWNYTENNFMRAVLALPDSGLAAVWTRFTPWAVELAGLGDPLVPTLLATARGDITVRNCSLLGDPTLRLFVTAPPRRLTAARAGNRVNLAWTPSPDAAQGYLVYRSENGLSGPFVRVSASPVAGSAFADPSAPSGPLLYQVRACQLLTTGCGAFTNTSQGAMADIRR